MFLREGVSFGGEASTDCLAPTDPCTLVPCCAPPKRPQAQAWPSPPVQQGPSFSTKTACPSLWLSVASGHQLCPPALTVGAGSCLGTWLTRQPVAPEWPVQRKLLVAEPPRSPLGTGN